MSNSKKTNRKKVKKSVSVKQSVEYDGKKTEVVVSNSQRVSPNQKEKIANDELLHNAIITSLESGDRVNNQINEIIGDDASGVNHKTKNSNVGSENKSLELERAKLNTSALTTNEYLKNNENKVHIKTNNKDKKKENIKNATQVTLNSETNNSGNNKKNKLKDYSNSVMPTLSAGASQTSSSIPVKKTGTSKRETNTPQSSVGVSQASLGAPSSSENISQTSLSTSLSNAKTSLKTNEKEAQKKDNTNKVLAVVTLVCFLTLAVVLGRFYLINRNYTGSSLNNTQINGVNVSGLNNKQAESLLASSFKEKAETFELTLTYGEKSWSFDKNDFIVTSEIHTILDEVQERERANSSYENQVNAVNKITKKGRSLNIAFNYIFVGLENKIDEIISEINYEPTDSVLTFNPNSKEVFNITQDKQGLKVNKEQLYYEINDQFNRVNKVNVEIPTLTIEPSVTTNYNKSLTKELSSFTSNVSDSTGNRKANVKLALDRVNGLIVNPGEEVSFNKLTGPHSSENGYKVATIIFNGQFVDGVGGGVCQASTTLYNALLLSDVEILQVSKHTLPVKYVPLGLDAMVAEGVADLKFKNNFEYPIFIKTSSNSESVSVKIYGHELEHGMEIKSRSEVVRKLAHSGDIIKQDTAQKYTDKVLYKGEQHRLTYPRNGFEAKAYLEYYKDGKLVTQKQVRHEIYYPQQGIIIEGVEEKPSAFNKIDESVEKIKAETQDTFMYTVMTDENLFDAIPTNYCP